MVSFRGQNLLKSRPDWSPLGVKFKISDEHQKKKKKKIPVCSACESPPPPRVTNELYVITMVLHRLVLTQMQRATLNRLLVLHYCATCFKNSRHFFSQSEVKPEAIVTRSNMYSRAPRRLQCVHCAHDWPEFLDLRHSIGLLQ